jgi:hypothetical protein
MVVDKLQFIICMDRMPMVKMVEYLQQFTTTSNNKHLLLRSLPIRKWFLSSRMSLIKNLNNLLFKPNQSTINRTSLRLSKSLKIMAIKIRNKHLSNLNKLSTTINNSNHSLLLILSNTFNSSLSSK